MMAISFRPQCKTCLRANAIFSDVRPLNHQHPPGWLICVPFGFLVLLAHDDVIKWKHFPRYWPFHRSPVNSPHKGLWRGALMFSLTFAWIYGWVNNREAGDLRCHRARAHYDVTVMFGDFRHIISITLSMYKIARTFVGWHMISESNIFSRRPVDK